VSTHKARLMQKLGVHSMADLVRYAMEHRLV
jgi:DNA-binding NarL/FixJ family response regulator